MIHYADELKQMVGETLLELNVSFLHESESTKTRGLDFYLPSLDIYIEVKKFHTERIVNQTVRADDIIVLQGRKSVEFFCLNLPQIIKKLKK